MNITEFFIIILKWWWPNPKGRIAKYVKQNCAAWSVTALMRDQASSGWSMMGSAALPAMATSISHVGETLGYPSSNYQVTIFNK
jgi:hypothetical protein